MLLGELIDQLAAADQTLVLPHGFHKPHSYRGFYTDIAFEPTTDITVADMLTAARSALGTTYQAYKGGDYEMNEYSDCWLAEYGHEGEGIGPLLVDLMLTAGQRTPTQQGPAPQPDDPARVTVRIIQSGQTTVTVDRAAYDEHAAAEDGLRYLLATAPARLPVRTRAVGPDGTVHDITPDPDETEPIHLHFGLSYSTHLVLPRVLLQSMPTQWQRTFVHLLDQFDTAFDGVEKPPGYRVEAADEQEVRDLTTAQRAHLDITQDWYRGETPPPDLDAQDLAEWQHEHEDPDGPVYYDRYGNTLEADHRVMVPVADPLPPYNRGRTRITPRLAGDA